MNAEQAIQKRHVKDNEGVGGGHAGPPGPCGVVCLGVPVCVVELGWRGGAGGP